MNNAYSLLFAPPPTKDHEYAQAVKVWPDKEQTRDARQDRFSKAPRDDAGLGNLGVTSLSDSRSIMMQPLFAVLLLCTSLGQLSVVLTEIEGGKKRVAREVCECGLRYVTTNVQV